MYDTEEYKESLRVYSLPCLEIIHISVKQNDLHSLS